MQATMATIEPSVATDNHNVEPTLDTNADPTLDTNVEPTLDTIVEPTLDTNADPTLDTNVEPTLDTNADPTLDTNVEPTLDTDVEPTLDTNVEPTLDTNVAVNQSVVPPEMAAPISSFDGGEATAVAGEKRKRGRPRKNPVDGTVVLDKRVEETTVNEKKRGRPLGSSGKKQASAPTGPSAAPFATQIMTVQAGEDVSSKIMSLCQNWSEALCIMSANGVISNVTLRQPSSSGGTVTYEGRFEILSLSGSYVTLESGGQRSRTGGMSITLAGPDGRMLGGGVAGLLVAATPVQVVVCNFAVGQETKSPKHADYSAGPSKPVNGGPTMRGTPPSESSDSPVNQSTDSNNNSVGMLQWK